LKRAASAIDSIRCVKLENRLPDEGINATHESPLREFAWLLGGSVALLVFAVVVVSYSAQWLAPRIPYRFEARLAAGLDLAAAPASESSRAAQAELQALLSGIASAAGIAAPRARSQAAVEVAGLPEVWQVVARLDVTTPAASLEALLRELAKRPWVRVERIEIRDATPAQAQLIVRAYVRKTGAAP